MQFDNTAAVETYKNWLETNDLEFRNYRAEAMKALEAIPVDGTFTHEEFRSAWKALAASTPPTYRSIPIAYRVIIELAKCGVIIIEKNGVTVSEDYLPSKGWIYKFAAEYCQ